MVREIHCYRITILQVLSNPAPPCCLIQQYSHMIMWYTIFVMLQTTAPLLYFRLCFTFECSDDCICQALPINCTSIYFVVSNQINVPFSISVQPHAIYTNIYTCISFALLNPLFNMKILILKLTFLQHSTWRLSLDSLSET